MVRKSNIIAVISPKGGVGKTVTTANLAAALSGEFNKKVLAVDTNVSSASLGLHFDIFYPKKTIHDTLTKGFHIKQAIYAYGKNLHIIPASIKIKKMDRNINNVRKNIIKLVENYDSMLNDLSKEYDIILLDCAPGFDLEAIAAMHVAGGLIIVANPEYPSMVSVAKAIEYARNAGVPLGGLVLNKVRGKQYEIKKNHIENSLKIKVLQEIPFDKKVPESIAKKIPIVFFKPSSKASRAYKELAGTILGRKYKSSWVREIFGKWRIKKR